MLFETYLPKRVKHQNQNLRIKSRKDELTKCKSDIVKGGTKFDKIKNINDYVYKRFCEEREKYSGITTRNLRLFSALFNMNQVILILMVHSLG